MRGDPLACQWRVGRTIEARPKGLTVAEPGKEEETGISIFSQNVEALQAAGFPLFTERVDRADLWAFIGTFKFKFLLSFSLTELGSFVSTAFPTEDLEDIPSYNSLDSMRALR
jgi:hypothetical protein